MQTGSGQLVADAGDAARQVVSFWGTFTAAGTTEFRGESKELRYHQ